MNAPQRVSPRRPAPAPARPRHLRVVRGRPAPGRRPPVGIFLIAGIATALALFAIVSIKVLLGQSALNSGDVEARIVEKMQRLETLQVDVARAESPSEIVRRAIEDLGLFHPDGLVPVKAAPPGPEGASGKGSR